MAPQIRRYPQGFGRALSALEFHLGETKEVAIIGSSGNPLEREVLTGYRPNLVIASSADPEDAADIVPLFDGRTMLSGRPTAYVCENFVCRSPVAEVDDLREMLIPPTQKSSSA
jgi:uncharacterized protein YyaL (SSP411 family)